MAGLSGRSNGGNMTDERRQLEREIIYACLYAPDAYLRYSRSLKPEFFADAQCRQFIEGIHKLVDAHAEITVTNLTLVVGEPLPLVDIRHGVVDLGIATRKLTELAIMDRKDQLVNMLSVLDEPFEVVNTVNGTSNEFAAMIAANVDRPKDSILNAYVDRLQQNGNGAVLRVRTGFPTLDEWCYGGLKLGNLSFLGGIPGSGKTTFMLRIGLTAAQRGDGVTLLEGEMPVDEILSRLGGMYLSQPVHEIERGEHMEGLFEFVEHFKKIKYEVQSTFERNVEALVGHIRKAIHDGSRLIMVDYLQVFVDKNGRAQDEFAKIKTLSEMLRKLTLINNVHIMAASSLNRLEHEAKRLTLNSFYGGSQLGFDCNTALVLHNDGIPDNGATRRTLVCDVVKNRGGRIGEFRILYDLERQDMIELDVHDEIVPQLGLERL